MLYALVGNGNPNRKEVVASLDSLRDGVYQRSEEEEFWLLMVGFNQENLSDACSDVVSWAIKKNVPFEVYNYLSETDNPEWQESADASYKADNPITPSLNMVKAIRENSPEDAAVLVISDDVYEDESAMDLVMECNVLGIPVFDLGGQMTQLEVEVVEEEGSSDDAQDTREETEPIEMSREDLEHLTLTELKAIVNDSGVVPRDMRSKDSLIEALLREEEGEGEPASLKESLSSIKEQYNKTVAPDPVNHDEEVPAVRWLDEETADEPEVKPVTKYWLSFIGADGELKSVPVNADDAEWLINPEG